MKNMKTLLLLSTSLLFVSCIKETKTVSKESNNGSVPDCYYSNSCVGGGAGTTTNGAAGGVGGGSGGGPIVSYPVNPNWGVHYPGGIPTGSCSAPYLENGVTSAYDTRKATVTAAGGFGYDPSLSVTAQYLNTSSILKDVTRAKTFFSTDANLKVRIKVNPQPDAKKTNDFCYLRAENLASMPGYTKLQFNVQAVGYRTNGSTDVEPLGVYTVGVNSCSPAIDLSPLKSMYPGGVYIILTSVQSNQDSWWDSNTGFTNKDTFKIVPSQNCWSVELEVATDTTKTFN